VRVLAAVGAGFAVAALTAWPALAATPAPGWTISAVAQPTNFSSARDAECETAVKTFGHELTGKKGMRCDRYLVTIRNEGAQATDGSTITISDTLPAGLTAVAMAAGESESGAGLPLQCGLVSVACTFKEELLPGAALVMVLDVEVSSSASGTLTNSVTVSGGGALPASTSVRTAVNSTQTPFSVTSFGFAAVGVDGAPDLRAGDHPNALTASFQLATSTFREFEGGPNEAYLPIQDAKDIVVDVPLGLVGDPRAASQCPQYQLAQSACPTSSRVGTLGIEAEGPGSSGIEDIPVFNLVPEHGYPAEFGFEYLEKEFSMYANVVPTASGYGLRVTVPGIPKLSHFLEITGITLTFFGDPAVSDGGATPSAAFFTNPMDCSAGPLKAKIAVDTWQDPGVFVSSEATTYPQVSGCNQLQFQPTVVVQPETAMADEPSGYNIDLRVPQAPKVFPVLGTPELRDAKFVFPEGLSASPGVADGLVGCSETGAEGINLSGPEAQAVGVDGQMHAVKGNCPAPSTLGTVEILTPLLESALTGHLYLAQPRCGGENKPACTEADATNGNLFGLYLEAEGSGVIIKLHGAVAADPATGRLTATFKQNPQLPFGELRIRLKGGPRAPLANPQACGSFSTMTDLAPWGSPTTPDATPSSSFEVPCPGSIPFAPSFSSGTVTPTAGAFSPFTLTLSRSDRQQDLSGISVEMPPGLLGMLSNVAQCPEPQASNGTCGPQSLIGHTTDGVGPGSQPFYVTGNVFLTGPYKGAPFGLSIVVHALAGPFDLGNVIVRARVNVDPRTAQISVVSDPLPQIVDGVPLRLQRISVITDKPGFMFNPTNCDQQAITGAITGAQGAAAQVSSPFAAAGCANLPFMPKFTARTQAKTSKANGASLDVTISAPRQGPQTNPAVAPEANIKKVDVQLPLSLPSRLTTLQKACPEIQFAANPAGCPAASAVGTAVANTPALPVPLEGPAYLVSHAAAAFPDLVLVLQGDGVVIELTGNTVIKKGITYSKFDTAPDAPISSFELKLPEGKYSALAAVGNLCALTRLVTVHKRVTLRERRRVRHVVRAVRVRTADSLRMPTTITFQNGGVMEQNTPIAVTGCSKAHAVRRARKASRVHSRRKASR
jgi:hypothetical protein